MDIGEDSAFGYFVQDGQLGAKEFFHVFGFVLPDEAVSFGVVEQGD